MARLLMHMLWEYHGERWPVLITNILKNALRAAYLSTSVQDYITLAFEALGPSTTFSEDYKDAVYNNIINILHVSNFYLNFVQSFIIKQLSKILNCRKNHQLRNLTYPMM